MSPGDAVKAWRVYRGLSQMRLAELAGVERNTVGNLERGLHPPQSVTLEKIAAALDTTLGELFKGPPSDWAQPHPEGIISEKDFDAPRDVLTREVALYESIPAGGWSDTAPERAGTHTVLRHLVRRDGYVVVRVHGDSMYSSFHDGDLVLVDTTITKPRSGQVVAAIYRGTTTMKRYRRIGGKPVLVADNPDWQPIEVDDPAELRILGIVLRIIDRDVSRAR